MANSAHYSRIIHELGKEFLVETGDNLQDWGELVDQLRTGVVEKPDGLTHIRCTVHNMKGMGGSFGFPPITVVSHRLEDYLSGLDTLNARHLDDL